ARGGGRGYRRGPASWPGRAASPRSPAGESRRGLRDRGRRMRPGRDSPLDADEQDVRGEGEDDRRDRAHVDLRRESPLIALEDEEPEATERRADRAGDRDEADRRYARNAQPGHHERHRQRQLDL